MKTLLVCLAIGAVAAGVLDAQSPLDQVGWAGIMSTGCPQDVPCFANLLQYPYQPPSLDITTSTTLPSEVPPAGSSCGQGYSCLSTVDQYPSGGSDYPNEPWWVSPLTFSFRDPTNPGSFPQVLTGYDISGNHIPRNPSTTYRLNGAVVVGGIDFQGQFSQCNFQGDTCQAVFFHQDQTYSGGMEYGFQSSWPSSGSPRLDFYWSTNSNCGTPGSITPQSAYTNVCVQNDPTGISDSNSVPDPLYYEDGVLLANGNMAPNGYHSLALTDSTRSYLFSCGSGNCRYRAAIFEDAKVTPARWLFYVDVYDETGTTPYCSVAIDPNTEVSTTIACNGNTSGDIISDPGSQPTDINGNPVSVVPYAWYPFSQLLGADGYISVTVQGQNESSLTTTGVSYSRVYVVGTPGGFVPEVVPGGGGGGSSCVPCTTQSECAPLACNDGCCVGTNPAPGTPCGDGCQQIGPDGRTCEGGCWETGTSCQNGSCTGCGQGCSGTCINGNGPDCGCPVGYYCYNGCCGHGGGGGDPCAPSGYTCDFGCCPCVSNEGQDCGNCGGIQCDGSCYDTCPNAPYSPCGGCGYWDEYGETCNDPCNGCSPDNGDSCGNCGSLECDGETCDDPCACVSGTGSQCGICGTTQCDGSCNDPCNGCDPSIGDWCGGCGSVQCDGSCNDPCNGCYEQQGFPCGNCGAFQCDGSCYDPCACDPNDGNNCGNCGTVQCDGSCNDPCS
jgi:hypothetical protein